MQIILKRESYSATHTCLINPIERVYHSTIDPTDVDSNPYLKHKESRAPLTVAARCANTQPLLSSPLSSEEIQTMTHPVYHKQLKILVANLPIAAVVLGVQTEKYLFSNAHHAKNHGVDNVDDACDMTLTEFFIRRQKRIAQLAGYPAQEAEYKISIHYANQREAL